MVLVLYNGSMFQKESGTSGLISNDVSGVCESGKKNTWVSLRQLLVEESKRVDHWCKTTTVCRFALLASLNTLNKFSRILKCCEKVSRNLKCCGKVPKSGAQYSW